MICNLGVVGPNPTGSSTWEVGTVGLRETVNLLGNRMGFDSLTSQVKRARITLLVFFLFIVRFAFADENQEVRL